MKENSIDWENISVIFSSLGTFFAFLLNVTPAILLYQVMKGKENYEIIPELMLIVNIISRETWLCYWIKEDVFVPLLNALIGTFISSSFLFIYLYYFTLKNKQKWFFYTALEFILEILLYFFYIKLIETSILGRMAMIFNIAMYVSPAQNILKVIRQKNYKLIPIWTTLVGVICSSCWLTFGLMVSNSNSIISNIVGVNVSIITSCTWGYYYHWSKIEKKVRKFKQLDVKIEESAERSAIKNYVENN